VIDHAADLELAVARFGAEPLAGDDADVLPADSSVSADERFAVFRLVFLDRAAVDDAGEEVADVVFAVRIGADDVVDAVGIAVGDGEALAGGMFRGQQRDE
jgi:hypothetical protein